MYDKILVPLDGSRAGNKAMEHAEEIARVFGSTVLLLRVVSPPTVPGAQMAAAGPVALYEMAAEAADIEHAALVKNARSQLNGKRRRLEADGIEAIVDVETGNAATVIRKIAKEQKVGLIVMSTRGRSGITRAVLGSVADVVVRSGVAPVLLVRR